MPNYAERNDFKNGPRLVYIDYWTIYVAKRSVETFETYLVKRIAASYDGTAGGNASANFGA